MRGQHEAPKRMRGIDLRTFLFDAPEENKDRSFSSLFPLGSQTGRLKEEWHDFIDSRPISDVQKKAAKNFTVTNTGVTVCWGPPGTGKTQTAAYVVEIAVRLGLKVLVIGQNNSSIDEALTKYLN